MAVRLGLPWEAAVRGLTIVPARQIGLDDRVGSLAPGKDADFFVTRGNRKNKSEQRTPSMASKT